MWRKLKKTGAYALKTSGYVLPDEPAHLERFQWLVQQVRDNGGEATLARVTKIEGLTDDDLAGFFNEARAQDYNALIKPLNELIAGNGRKARDGFVEALAKIATAVSGTARDRLFRLPHCASRGNASSAGRARD